MKNFWLIVCISSCLHYPLSVPSLCKKKLPKIPYKIPFDSPADQYRKEPVCKRESLYKHPVLPVRPQTASPAKPCVVRYLSDHKAEVPQGPLLTTTVLSMLQTQNAQVKQERSKSVCITALDHKNVKAVMQTKSPTLASMKIAEDQRKRLNSLATVLNNFAL